MSHTMERPPHNVTAKELMAYWQSEHDKNDKDIVDIWNWCRDDDYHRHFYSSFSEAMELLRQAVEKGTFHKPIYVSVEGKNGQQTVLDAVEKNRLSNIQRLRFFEYSKDVGEHQCELEWLSRCIESGKLPNLDYICIDGIGEKVDIFLLALATGKAPNLEEIEIYEGDMLFRGGDFDAATKGTFVRALLGKKLSKLQKLSCYGFELKDHIGVLRVPPEFADKSNNDIMAFLSERWEFGEVQLATAKVIVTGPTTVGKTCLVHCLKGNKFSPDPGSTNTMEIGKQTEDGGFVLYYHDFAGQDVYALARAMFGQSSVVYLVLWDRNVETGGDEAAHQFARDVLEVNPNAKFIFVTTKGDLERHNSLTFAEQDALKKDYGDKFLGYYHVSAQSGVGVDELRAAIKSAANFANVLMPKTYEDLRKSLQKLPESHWYFSREEWDALCESVKISGDDRVDLALRLFLDMGEVVGLSGGHLVVKPSVLVDVLSRVVTVDERYRENARGGYLRHDELEYVWSDYPKELHKGFLDLIHHCDIGFPLRDDEAHEYRATLIPAMMVESSDEEIRRWLRQLQADIPKFEAGPEIVVELSNLSNQLWPKLAVKLGVLAVFGGWWPNGCIIVDTDANRNLRSFGAVLFDRQQRRITLLTYGCSPSTSAQPPTCHRLFQSCCFTFRAHVPTSSIQLLRYRALDALRGTLECFPGVYIKSLRIGSVDSWSEEWSHEKLFHSTLDKSKFENRGAPDVAEWLLKVKEKRRTELGARRDSSFGYFTDMLKEDSGASDEVLCYLLLSNQQKMLTVGCEQNRLKLNALWLVYEKKGKRMVCPLCPHLFPGKLRVNKELEVHGVPNVDQCRTSDDQIAMNSLLNQVVKRLKIVPPSHGAAFREILWNDGHGKCEHEVQMLSQSKFQPVRVDNLNVFVHESDERFFTSPCQVRAISELTEKARRSISEMRTGRQATTAFGRVARVPAHHMAEDSRQRNEAKRHRQMKTDEEEARLFQLDPFNWLRARFHDGEHRKECMESVLFQTPITSEIANEIKSKIRDIVRQEFPDFHDFYPEVIISYSTGSRKDMDVESAGPALMVVGALVDFLFDQGHPCYSDIMTPGGRDWREYMLRLVKAKVMVLLITDTFCRSVHCLEEVAVAVANRVPIIPVRLDEKSVNGMDITRDTEAMWPDEELEKYAQQDRGLLAKLELQRFEAIRELSRGASIPDHGTILSQPNATDDLLKRIRELV